MDSNLSRREVVLRGALAGAALALPAAPAVAGVRRRRPRRSVHCLEPHDRFAPATILADCSFAAFAPDRRRIALTTPRGIELLDRRTGSRSAITPPGFTLAAGAWHPDGGVLIASGPAGDGSGPHLHAVAPDGSGVTRLLPGHPGAARAASFSPDGRKVAFTYLNRFQHQLAIADWSGGQLASPLNLFPVDPATEPSTTRVLASLAWHETRGFSADGRRLYYASDRGSGMLNVNLHYINLARGRHRHVTREQGVVEGAVLAPDDGVLYYSTTSARESGFMSLVSAPVIPPFLGFVAEPALHGQLAERRLAPIGNGDVLAVDGHYGMYARMVARRDRLARKLGTTVSPADYRIVACSRSASGDELSVAMHSSAGSSNVLLLRRRAGAVPKAARIRATPAGRGAAPLASGDAGPLERRMAARYGGHVQLKLDGTLAEGSFRVALDNFNVDGVGVYSGEATFQTGAGGFRHVADVRRVNFDPDEEAHTFYRADMSVAWRPAGSDPLAAPQTGGTLESRSRHGVFLAAYDGATFVPQDGWRAGRRRADPIPGARVCRKPRRK